MPTPVPSDPLLTIEEAAARLRVTPRTLEYWRLEGKGPAVVVFGRMVRYRAGALEAFLDAHSRRGAS